MPIGEIKKIEVDAKPFELKKQGVNTSLTVQSIFIRLLMVSGMDPDMPDNAIEMALVAGLHGPILTEVQAIIQDCVFAPKITPETYNDLSFNEIPKLFFQIYMFQVGKTEKKSDLQSGIEKFQTKKKDFIPS